MYVRMYVQDGSAQMIMEAAVIIVYALALATPQASKTAIQSPYT